MLGRGTGVVPDGDEYSFEKLLPTGASCPDPNERINVDDAGENVLCGPTNQEIPEAYAPKDVVRVNAEESVRLWVSTPRGAIAGQYVWWGPDAISSLLLTLTSSHNGGQTQFNVCCSLSSSHIHFLLFTLIIP